jgi:hypothetical protein
MPFRCAASALAQASRTTAIANNRPICAPSRLLPAIERSASAV